MVAIFAFQLLSYLFDAAYWTQLFIPFSSLAFFFVARRSFGVKRGSLACVSGLVLFFLLLISNLRIQQLNTSELCAELPQGAMNLQGEVLRVLSRGEQILSFSAELDGLVAFPQNKILFRAASLPWYLGSSLEAGNGFLAAGRMRNITPAKSVTLFETLSELTSNGARMARRGYCARFDVDELLLPRASSLSKGTGLLASEMFQAVFLGNRSLLSLADIQLFRSLGISHLLVISGFHVALLFASVCGLFRALLNLFPSLFVYVVREKAVYFTGLVFLLFYALGLALGLSLLRALFALVLYLLLKAASRSVSRVNALLLVVVLLHLWQPLAFFEISFQFTILALLGILLAVTADDLKKTFASRFRVYVRVCFFTWLCTLPVALLNFGEISALAPLTSFWASPLFCFLLFYPGLLLQVLALALPMLAPACQCLFSLLSASYLRVLDIAYLVLAYFDLTLWRLSAFEVSLLFLASFLVISLRFCRLFFEYDGGGTRDFYSAGSSPLLS